jgi:hypothetical protein
MRLTHTGYKTRLKRLYMTKSGVRGVVSWPRRQAAEYGKKYPCKSEQQLGWKEVVQAFPGAVGRYCGGRQTRRRIVPG